MDWKNKIDVITNKIKNQFFASKQDDLQSLYTQLQIYDPQNLGVLEQSQFESLLQKLGIFLTTQEQRNVYDQFLKDSQVNYKQFFDYIRQQISEKRIQTIKEAFNFSTQNKSSISIDQLARLYQPQEHFRVKTNQKTVDQIKSQFLNGIKSKRHIFLIFSSDGQNITLNEFYEYYLDVNATLPTEKEDFFLELLVKTWGITCGKDYISPEHLMNLENIFFQKIKLRTLPQQNEGQTLQKAFKYYDVNQNQRADFKEFINLLKSLGCNFTESEYKALFSKYETNKSGQIMHQDLCQQVLNFFSAKVENYNTLWNLTQQPPSALIDTVNQQISKSNKNLLEIFEKNDNNKNGYLSRNQFQQALKEFGLNFGHVEINKFAQFFDSKQEEKIYYHQFMQYIK